MKEVRFFYVPDAADNNELPEEEAAHAIRVLRLSEGDEVMLMDGAYSFYKAVITSTTKKQCFYSIAETLPQEPLWNAHLHLAMAPTKNIDRVEWFAEKATEIGFDELSFLNCRFSERRTVNVGRIDRIVVSAMKQSHKPSKPKMNDMTDFHDFVHSVESKAKFICHCCDTADNPSLKELKLLKDVLVKDEDSVVLIGPEGDFSMEEILDAQEAGFIPVSLGRSRLRTETAALVAVHLMNLANQ